MLAVAPNDVLLWSSTPFWTFLATIAFIVQIFLQRRYAQEAAAKVDTVNNKTDIATKKVEEVSQALKVTSVINKKQLQNIQQTADQVHTLVNNAMSVVLAENALLARRIATMTGLPEDAVMADEAERVSRAHDANQKKVDVTDAKLPPRPADGNHS